MHHLYYQIAGHTIIIETPDDAATSALLPNFKPFGVSKPDNEVLFRFSGGTPLALPNQQPDDDFDWNGIHYTVYTHNNGRMITMSLNGKQHFLYAAPDWKYLYSDLTMTHPNEAQFLNNFLIVGFGMASAPLRTLKIHASVTELNGKALLFLGKSGTGKSTHSRLWREFVPDCSLLNDDEPVIRMDEDDVVRVFGTPWSGKTPCYKNQSAEVTAFVHLYQNAENKLTKLKSLDAFTSVYLSTSVMRSDSDNKNYLFETVADILQKVPVYRLDCRPDREAVSLTETLLKE